MEIKLIIYFFLGTVNLLFSQQQESWIRFEDKKTFLKGYKDESGDIKIQPKFTYLTNAIVFENIIPVFEELNLKIGENSRMISYYLLKNGQKMGADSLYVYNTTLDCENENKIRFRDLKTNKVGFFDIHGKVVIPAIYDDAKPFYNGFAVVIKQGKRMCWEEGEYSGSNPYEEGSWKGNFQLINDENEIIAENVPFENLKTVDWFSVKKNCIETNTDYVTFKSANGDSYSFLNYEKEFEHWFYNEFLTNSSETSLFAFLSDEVTIDLNKKLQNDNYKIQFKDSFWKEGKKETVFQENKEFIIKIINGFKNRNNKKQISEGTSPVLYRYENRKDYFSNCGEYQNIKFPYFQVHLVDNDSKITNTLGFIKSRNKYKLLEIF